MNSKVNATKTNYYAHSGKTDDTSDWQPLLEHLQNVGNIAAVNANVFGAAELARISGLLHDLGKYSQAFQDRLHGSKKRADHATAGAKVASEKWGKIGQMLAFVIAGHHAGLANGINEGQERRTLTARLASEFGKDIPDIDDCWQQQIGLPEKIALPRLKVDSGAAGFQMAFLIRMLYSALVDADFIDTDNFYRKLEGKIERESQFPTLDTLRNRFDIFLENLQTASYKDSKINRLRQEILNYARNMAITPVENNGGLFSLTVPTGGGKTLTSMAFALDHATSQQKQRIIYVIPLTSIIEQNAKVFRESFGEFGESAVLEHHSAFEEGKIAAKDAKDKLRLAMENWDAPVIVTTAVQFFESLFADRSSQCRKLHNIANSVIILDEAQTLPLKYLRPIMEAIKELARNYRCSVVLCTATQPALKKEQNFYNGFDHIVEIAPDPERLYRELQRVQVVHLGEQSDEALLAHLTSHQQILMIVNNRRHAHSLYEGMKHLTGARHLTTLMCAKHRSQVLDEIRANLLSGKPCRVVSTSLIEAGVDVDFPCVFRAETGLDSVAQAAGRCNREGKRSKEESKVYIFRTLQNEWQAPPELAQLAANMREIVRNHSEDLLAPAAIVSYFEGVYWSKASELDTKNILQECQDHLPELSFPFQSIAQNFRMIENYQIPVIIPFNQEAESLIEQLRFADKVGGIARKLQSYLVQIPRNGIITLQKHGRIDLIAPEKFGNQFWTLIGMDLYDPQSGLSWKNPSFLESESFVM